MYSFVVGIFSYIAKCRVTTHQNVGFLTLILPSSTLFIIFYHILMVDLVKWWKYMIFYTDTIRHFLFCKSTIKFSFEKFQNMAWKLWKYGQILHWNSFAYFDVNNWKLWSNLVISEAHLHIYWKLWLRLWLIYKVFHYNLKIYFAMGSNVQLS